MEYSERYALEESGWEGRGGGVAGEGGGGGAIGGHEIRLEPCVSRTCRGAVSSPFAFHVIFMKAVLSSALDAAVAAAAATEEADL